jgi:4-amino-4-deoxy-L-arabinose transferase-like glycosyltransferase
MMVGKWILALILIVGATLRLAGASQAPIELIERDEFIPTAMSITKEHLPLRATQHGIVPAYIIRAGGLVFGNSILGLRLTSVIAGTATILLLYLVATRWWGQLAGLIAAGLLSIERYHIEISGRAIDLPLDLFFIALAIYTFSRFLYAIDQRGTPAEAGRWLYGTAAACALGFLCKELTALMAPVLLLSILLVGQSAWLRKRQTWLAVGIFVLIISPDIYANLTTTETQRVALRDHYLDVRRELGTNLPEIYDLPEIYEQSGLYMSYRDQLSRFRSFGFDAEPFYFYFGNIFDGLGIQHDKTFDEFPFVNPWLACILWVGVALSFMRRDKDDLTVTLLTMFTLPLLVLASVRLGPPRGDFPTDSTMLWYWADRTMLPALLLTGRALSLLARDRTWEKKLCNGRVS